jgi:rare lipoprotein A
LGPAEILDDDGLACMVRPVSTARVSGAQDGDRRCFRRPQFTAASNHFPLGTQGRRRRLDNDRCAIVKVNDRMHAKHRRRVIDVSRGVAEYLGMFGPAWCWFGLRPEKAGTDNAQGLSCGVCRKMTPFLRPWRQPGPTVNRQKCLISGMFRRRTIAVIDF